MNENKFGCPYCGCEDVESYDSITGETECAKCESQYFVKRIGKDIFVMR